MAAVSPPRPRFCIWGLLPLYLKALQSVPVLQVTAHRLVWGCVFAFGWLRGARRDRPGLRARCAIRTTRWRLCASATLISINWITYVWGIAANRVVETSLGYFINPLVNVLLGVVILSRAAQRRAVDCGRDRRGGRRLSDLDAPGIRRGSR